MQSGRTHGVKTSTCYRESAEQQLPAVTPRHGVGLLGSRLLYTRDHAIQLRGRWGLSMDPGPHVSSLAATPACPVGGWDLLGTRGAEPGLAGEA